MDFIEKLIVDTYKGDWDFFWKYSDGASTYSITKPKHYLSGLNFSLDKDETLITFPNGYGLMCPKEQLRQLRDEINLSLERTVDECIQLYLAGKEMTAEQEKAESEKAKATATSGSKTETSGSKVKAPVVKKPIKV
jgi:hypothetical protein